MENGEEDKSKKETGCLFFNFEIKRNLIPLSTEITKRNKTIKKMCSDMSSVDEKFLFSTKEQYLKKNMKKYKFFWSQYMNNSNNSKKEKKENSKNNNHCLSSKIYFGPFFNQNCHFDGMDNVKKYDQIKKMITKSSNFSFLKDPKSINFC